MSRVERPSAVVGFTELVILATIVALSGAPLNGADPVVRLTDVAARAGITLLNISGSPSKDLVMDANGNGAAWLDFDRDGDLDALIVNGSTWIA